MRQERARWPQAVFELWEELRGHPGRVALIDGVGAEEVLERLASALQAPAVRVGAHLTTASTPPTEREVAERLQDAPLLADCEILFDPELGVDPLQLIRGLARRGPRIAVWPGRITTGWATYSEPGRRDHYERGLADALVLRPRQTAFPDEVPYTIERVP